MEEKLGGVDGMGDGGLVRMGNPTTGPGSTYYMLSQVSGSAAQGSSLRTAAVYQPSRSHRSTPALGLEIRFR